MNDEELDFIPRLDFNNEVNFIICNGALKRADYMNIYKDNNIGFNRNEEPEDPLAYLVDNYMDVYIEIYEREDNSVLWYIDYDYIIDADLLLRRDKYVQINCFDRGRNIKGKWDTYFY